MSFRTAALFERKKGDADNDSGEGGEREWWKTHLSPIPALILHRRRVRPFGTCRCWLLLHFDIPSGTRRPGERAPQWRRLRRYHRPRTGGEILGTAAMDPLRTVVSVVARGWFTHLLRPRTSAATRPINGLSARHFEDPARPCRGVRTVVVSFRRSAHTLSPIVPPLLSLMHREVSLSFKATSNDDESSTTNTQSFARTRDARATGAPTDRDANDREPL